MASNSKYHKAPSADQDDEEDDGNANTRMQVPYSIKNIASLSDVTENKLHELMQETFEEQPSYLLEAEEDHQQENQPLTALIEDDNENDNDVSNNNNDMDTTKERELLISDNNVPNNENASNEIKEEETEQNKAEEEAIDIVTTPTHKPQIIAEQLEESESSDHVKIKISTNTTTTESTAGQGEQKQEPSKSSKTKPKIGKTNKKQLQIQLEMQNMYNPDRFDPETKEEEEEHKYNPGSKTPTYDTLKAETSGGGPMTPTSALLKMKHQPTFLDVTLNTADIGNILRDNDLLMTNDDVEQLLLPYETSDNAKKRIN